MASAIPLLPRSNEIRKVEGGVQAVRLALMANGEGWKLPKTVSLKKRLLWWLGIYFGFQIPLILLWPFILSYPTGLAPYFAFLTGSRNEAAFRGWGYPIYLVHFAISMLIPSQRIFRALMVILIVFVSLNTISCMREMWPAWLKGMPKIEG